ncbi:MAG: SDR family NAD(P)-dependent oxidoreductase [Gordonia paraffinivorans]
MARSALPAVPTLDLHDAVVLVTGAAGGIGRAVARELHGRGARLVLLDLDLAAVRDAARDIPSDRVICLAADVTRRDDLDTAVAVALDTWGRLDVAFANAGISGGDTADTVASVADGVFERVVAVNLQGVWNTVRATLPAVLDAQGHMLLTSSTYAYVNGMVNAPYAATKAAVEQIGRALRVEVRRHGATAGVLYPGWVRTPHRRRRLRQGPPGDGAGGEGVPRAATPPHRPVAGGSSRRRRDRTATCANPGAASVDPGVGVPGAREPGLRRDPPVGPTIARPRGRGRDPHAPLTHGWATTAQHGLVTMRFTIVNVRTVVTGPYGVSPPIPIRSTPCIAWRVSSEMPTAPCLPRPGGRRSEMRQRHVVG